MACWFSLAEGNDTLLKIRGNGKQHISKALLHTHDDVVMEFHLLIIA